METLDALRDAVRGAIQKDYEGRARQKLKKELLDALDARYGFDLPQTLVDQEFAAVWSQVEADLKNNGKTFADEGTTEEEARASTAGSPSAGCGSGWFLRRSARRPISRWPTTR
jgi:trigger factor